MLKIGIGDIHINENLRKYSDILRLPVYSEEISYLAYPVIIKKPKTLSRKKMRELEKRCIEVRPVFGCIPTQQPAYKYLRERYNGKLPNADYVEKNGFYIGCHQYLTGKDLKFIAHVFNEILQNI